MQADPVHVVAAAICDDAGRVLVTRRAAHVHQGGKWEFPGGKVEAGESARDALHRELHEELGITPLAERPLLCLSHDYGDKQVQLETWRVDDYSGRPVAREGQPLRWSAIERLHREDFPAANRAIISALQLPTTILVTPPPPADSSGWRGFLDSLHCSVSTNAVRMVQLRAPALAPRDFIALAGEVGQLCGELGVRLVLNTEPAVFEQVAADGLHLSGRQLASCSQRPVDAGIWLSTVCHNHDEVLAAGRAEVDFVLVSPVRPTASHAGAPVLGWAGFAELAGLLDCPAYALGGMSPADLPRAFEHGAQGIAAISSLWKDKD